MDQLVEEAKASKRQIKVVKDAATLAYYRKCAAVVDDERRRGDAHGAQRRAADRLGFSAQHLGRMLADLAAADSANSAS